MIYNLEIYNPEKTYITPDNKIATPQQIQQNYSAVNAVKCVIYTDASGEMLYAIEPFNAMRSRLGVQAELSDKETLEQLESIINSDQIIEITPTAEERMAATLEFQTLLMM